MDLGACDNGHTRDEDQSLTNHSMVVVLKTNHSLLPKSSPSLGVFPGPLQTLLSVVSSPPLLFLLSVTAFHWLNLPEGKLGKQLPVVQSREGARMNLSRHRRITGTEPLGYIPGFVIKDRQGVFSL